MDKETATKIAQRESKTNTAWQGLVDMAEEYPVQFNEELKKAMKMLREKKLYRAGTAIAFVGMKVSATLVRKLSEISPSKERRDETDAFERRKMSDVKTVKVRADVIMQVMSDSVLSKKNEDDIILQVEQQLNSLQPFKFDHPYAKVGVRVHIKGD